jgi:GDP-4-dehydro-6-deoxy-D-mannose reductase
MAGEEVKKPLPFSSVLVTGADGFVGRALVPLLRRSLSPAARLNLSTRAAFAAADNLQWVDLDLGDPATLRRCAAETRPDLIVHLAAQSSSGQSAALAADTWETNALGTFQLARAVCAVSPAATFFFVSSAEVYGQTFNLGTAIESSELRPQSVYARTKAAAEAILADTLPETARSIVVRPSNHSGPGQDSRFVLPAFAEQIARIEAGLSEPILRTGNLDPERDFMDVRDVVRAYALLIDAAATLPMRATFNIASGNPRPIRYFLDRLLRLARCPIEVQPDPERMRPSEVPRAALAATAIREATGWVPEVPIDEMLASLLEDQRRRVSSKHV